MFNHTLDRLTLTKPCDADWDSMAGNDQVRFCKHCDLHVTNLSSISRTEARRVVESARGRICVRYMIGPSGGVHTQKMPEQLYRIGRRASRIAAGAFTATLSLSSGAAQTRVTSAAPSVENVARVETSGQREQLVVDFSASVSGTITTREGTPIADAKVFLVDRESGEERTTTSSGMGQYTFQILPAGNYLLWVHKPTFDTDTASLSIAAGGAVQQHFELEKRELRWAGGAMTVVVEEEPLLLAIEAGDVEGLRRLLSVPVKFGRIARATLHLSSAVKGGNREIVRLLLDAGADPNFLVQGNDPALLSLSDKATPELVQDLILAGAKLNARDDNGSNALIIASRSSNELVVKELINAGVQVNANNSAGETALFAAARENTVGVVTLLLNAGINVNATNDHGDNALLSTLPNGSFENFKLLVDRGSDWTLVNDDGQTALILAAENEQPDIASFLIEHGLSVNAQDKHSNTALMMAAGMGHDRTAGMLMKAGADPNLPNSQRFTALMYAAIGGRAELVRMLLESGADPTAKSTQGKTALAYARESDREEVIQLLTSRGVRR